jgi:hypothetical protein
MVLAAAGGGGGGTPWAAYDVPTLWSMVKDQDTDSLWKQVTGWQNTADLTSLHVSNLKEYRDQLAGAWPPERSDASAAYLAELDKLITSVQQTHDVASKNYSAMTSIALAASDAKYKLKPIYDEYAANKKKLDDYNALVEADKADTTAMPTVSPGAPPIAPGRQDELTTKAQGVMSNIGSEISLAAATIKPPTPYVPPKPIGGKDDLNGTSGGSSAGSGPVLIPPVVPPVAAAPHTTTATPTHFSAPTTGSTPSTTTTLPSTGIGQGPVLGGVTPTPTLPASTILTPSLPGPMAPPTITPGAMPPGGLIGPGNYALPATGISGPGVIGGLPTSGTGALKTFGTPATAGARAMPAGSVIGGSPGSGLGQPARGLRPASRVNPPGGVIGGNHAAEGAAAGAGRGGAGSRPYAPTNRSGHPHDEDGALLHWDPDNPWETEEGVAPVVLPPPDAGRIDPGPAIGQGR